MINTRHSIASFLTLVIMIMNLRLLTSQYRTKPVLELMKIIDAPVPATASSPQAGPSTERKRNLASEDAKPGQEVVLAARVKELEVGAM
jgi:hypothetical protein